jgi:exonuclease III
MNVRSLFSNTKKRSDVFNWFKAKKISIVCFQETHSTKDVAVKWEDEWGSTFFFSHGDSKSAGVSVMFQDGSNNSNVYLRSSIFLHAFWFLSCITL